jgi:catechol 2,3-dioxygenase
MTTIPERLLFQLAHVELINPDPEGSARFFHDVLGLEESGRDGRSIYFRGWGERFHHSLIVTEGPEALGQICWRAAGPKALMHPAQRLEASRHGGLGRPGHGSRVTGHGPAYRFRGPGGHVEEVFWEVERFRATGELAPVFPRRPQRYRPRGVAVRQIDHVTIPTSDIFADAEFRRDVLGFRFIGWTGRAIRIGSSSPSARRTSRRTISAWCSSCPSTGVVSTTWRSGWTSGRTCCAALTYCSTTTCRWSTGRGRHGMGEIEFIYFREPGGARVELNSGGYRNDESDPETVRWTPQGGPTTGIGRRCSRTRWANASRIRSSMRHVWRRSSPSTTTDRPAGSGSEITVCLQSRAS